MAPVAPKACMRSLATMPGTTRWMKAMKKMAAGMPHISHRLRARSGRGGRAHRVQKPSGSQARTTASSSSAGVGVAPTSVATRSSQPVAAFTLSTLCPG